MVLISARVLIIKGEPPKAEYMLEEHLPYAKVLEKIHSAMAEKYEPAFISDDEFTHLITFLRYVSGSNAVETITVRGTLGEIEDLQNDPLVRKHLWH